MIKISNRAYTYADALPLRDVNPVKNTKGNTNKKIPKSSPQINLSSFLNPARHPKG